MGSRDKHLPYALDSQSVGHACAQVLPPLACPMSFMRARRGCTALALSSVMSPPRAPPGRLLGVYLPATIRLLGKQGPWACTTTGD